MCCSCFWVMPPILGSTVPAEGKHPPTTMAAANCRCFPRFGPKTTNLRHGQVWRRTPFSIRRLVAAINLNLGDGAGAMGKATFNPPHSRRPFWGFRSPWQPSNRRLANNHSIVVAGAAENKDPAKHVITTTLARGIRERESTCDE